VFSETATSQVFAAVLLRPFVNLSPVAELGVEPQPRELPF
jgi:hypothetical protein